MEWNEVTRKDLEENASELLEELREEWRGEIAKLEKERDQIKAKLTEQKDPPDEVKKLTEQLVELQQKVAAAELHAEVEAMLREASLSDAPAELVEALKRAEDADARKALLELFSANISKNKRPQSHLKTDKKESTDAELDAVLTECWGGHRHGI